MGGITIEKLPAANFWTDPASRIEAVVLHGSSGDKAGGISWLRSQQSGVSANYFVGKDGSIAELVDWRAGKRAWANGIVLRPDPTLNWLRRAIAAKVSPNLITVSIEHEASRDDMLYHRSMPAAQFDSSVELTAMILRAAGLKATHETVVAHCQIDSVNKATCPGVIFVPAYVNDALIVRNPDLRP